MKEIKNQVRYRKLADLKKLENNPRQISKKDMEILKTTLTSTSAQNDNYIFFDSPKKINDKEIKLASTFPLDYKIKDKNIGWLCGMSVPPVMTAQVSYKIYLQWLKPLKEGIYD